jgi:hypothetical protein
VVPFGNYPKRLLAVSPRQTKGRALRRFIDPRRAGSAAALLITGCALTACWTPPVANVQPRGEPRLIQSAIPVISVKDAATVQAIDLEKHTITLRFAQGSVATIQPGSTVSNFSKIRAGDTVRATVVQELSVFVLKDGRLSRGDGTAESISSDARILIIEPSYRLLTLQYPNRKAETFKVGLEAKLTEMEPGDDVTIRTTALRAVRIEKR